MIVLEGIGKRGEGSLVSKFVIHLILVGLVFVIFMVAISGMTSGRDIKQQVLEKELALLIDAGAPGFSFEIMRVNVKGVVGDVRVEDGRIYVDVDGFRSSGGYPYFSRYDVEVEESKSKFIVRIVDE